MNTFLEKIVDNTLSFFFDKRANKLFSKVQTTYEYNILKSKIQNYSERYFEEQFYHIPVVEEFDFDGLNDFLHENFLEKIVPCFNAPYYEQRLFFTEQLYRQSYEYASAVDCRKQNTVHIYVDNILKITETYFLEKIDGKDLLLANHTVDQIMKFLKVTLQEYNSKIEDYFSYYKSFAKNIDNIKHVFRTDKQYHYLNKKIRFFGRTDEFQYLDSFLAEPDGLLYTVITGPGGAGKSKLMYHYMQQNIGNLDWKIIFPTHGQVKQLCNFDEYKYPKNLLIIIDYAGEIAETVGSWLNNMIHCYSLPQKLRIVLLERQNSNNNSLEPYWYQELYKANAGSIKGCCYKQKFYQLKPLKKSEIFSLIDNIAANERKQLNNEEKEAIYDWSVKLNHNKDEKYFNTPLMIILITDAYINGQNIKSFDTQKLMEYVIQKNRRYWENTVCKSNQELYNSLSKLLVYATAIGGWDLKPLEAPLTEDSKYFLNQYSKTEMQEHFIDLLKSNENNNITLMPLEPDPIGEYFVLWFLSEYTYHTDYKEFITLLWSKPVEFAYFLDRCIDSYLYQSLFDTLIYGEYSIINSNTEPILSAELYVSLSAFQPLETAAETIELLRLLQKDNPENQEIALEYARGLVNLSNKQGLKEAAETIEKLCSLHGSYPENQEIALAYANGLVNLTAEQGAEEAVETIEKLCFLKESYAGNQEIALAYAKGLVNLTAEQGAEEAAETIETLYSLQKDNPENQKIAYVYANGLVNLAAKQGAEEAAETAEKVCSLHKSYPENQEIALMYVIGLVNLSNKQELSKSKEISKQLKKLLEDYPDLSEFSDEDII